MRLRGHRAGPERQGARLPRAAGRHHHGRRARHQGRSARPDGFGVDEAAAATELNPANLEKYRALVFLNTAGDLLNAEQESAVQRFVEQGNGFLGIGSAAQGESGSFFDGLIGARPTAGSPTATTSQTRRPAATACTPRRATLPLLWTRSDVWYQWAARVTGTVHVVARYRAAGRAGRRCHQGHGTTHDTPISWCRDYRGGRSFYTGMGRTAAPTARPTSRSTWPAPSQWTSGLTRGNCKATINSNYKAHADHERRRGVDRPDDRRRVARHRDRQQRLDALHRPRRLPHRRRARRAAEPAVAGPHPHARRSERRHRLRFGAHLSTRRPPTARSTAASRWPASSPSTATAARAARRPPTPTTRWSTACSASRRRRTSPPRVTSTCSTSRPSTRTRSRPACRSSAASRRCRARGSRASRSTCRHEEARPRLRGPDLRVRRPDLLLLPRRRRHGLRLQGQPVRHDG